MRLYQPQATVLDGTYKIPPITKVSSDHPPLNPIAAQLSGLNPATHPELVRTACMRITGTGSVAGQVSDSARVLPVHARHRAWRIPHGEPRQRMAPAKQP